MKEIIGIFMFFDKMTDEEYKHFKIASIESYAYDLAKTMNKEFAEAKKTAKEEFEALLPLDNLTPNHYLISIKKNKLTNIGVIWYLIHESSLFICDFLIYEEYRRNGYATETLRMIDVITKLKGLSDIRLNVFKHNSVAFNIYINYGYRIIEDDKGSCIMEKIISL